jgi:6-phosphogluconolactonase
MNMVFHFECDADSLAEYAAELFVAQIQEVLENQDLFTAVLSGGSTPKRMFQVLAERFSTSVPWKKVHFFWADERVVPMDHPESNFGVAFDTFLTKIDIDEKNLHPIKTGPGNPRRIAAEYEKDMRDFFSTLGLEVPRFDFLFLGIGQDGHTASLFPDSMPGLETLKGYEGWVVSLWVPHLNAYRISMTPMALNQARKIVFLVSGKGKAKILGRIQADEPELPASELICPKSGDVLWLVDQEAGEDLKFEAA